MPNQEIPFITKANCFEQSYISIQKEIKSCMHNLRRKNQDLSQIRGIVGKWGKKVWIGKEKGNDGYIEW